MGILIYINDGELIIRYPEGMPEQEALARVDCTLSFSDRISVV